MLQFIATVKTNNLSHSELRMAFFIAPLFSFRWSINKYITIEKNFSDSPSVMKLSINEIYTL